MDFERKVDFKKTCKKSYTWSLCITDPEYEGHDQEIWSFGLFVPQTDKKSYTANTYGFWAKIWKFWKPIQTHISDHHVLRIRNMGLMRRKYGVPDSFYRKLTIFGKMVAKHIWILSRKLIFLKYVKTHIRDHYVLLI
jgi:hypothetical protein